MFSSAKSDFELFVVFRQIIKEVNYDASSYSFTWKVKGFVSVNIDVAELLIQYDAFLLNKLLEFWRLRVLRWRV